MRSTATAAASLLAGAACAAPASVRPLVVPAPAAFPAFPAQIEQAPVSVEAALVLAEGSGGRDLGARAAAERLLPVRLELRASSAAAGARLSPGSFEPALYLQDGTPLSFVPPRELPAALVDEETLALGPIPAPSAEPRAGLLFFRLGSMRVSRRWALAGQGPARRELDLLRSLLAFQVESRGGEGERGSRIVRVGLRPLASEGEP